MLSEEHLSYQSYDTYNSKCKHVNILPLGLKFDLNDLLFSIRLFKIKFLLSYHHILNCLMAKHILELHT